MKEKDYFIHRTACVDKAAAVGRGTKIWHFSHIMDGAVIGKDCKIGQNVFVGRDVIIGNNVKIQNNVSLYPGLTMEDDVFCGPSAVFTNIKYPRSAIPRNSREFYLKTRVKKGATIGANATIVCGVVLEQYCFIGAGAVVVKDVPAYALVYGNPAKIEGWSCMCGFKLSFKGVNAECEECSRRYKKNKGCLQLRK